MNGSMRISLNGALKEVPAPCSIHQLVVDVLGITVATVAVERNGLVAPRRTWADVLLGEGDRLEVVTFVGGG